MIDEDVLRAYSKGRALYAMVLIDVRPLDPPLQYVSKQGAVLVITNVALRAED